MKSFPIKIRKISVRITLYFTLILLLIALAITIINVYVYSEGLEEQISNVATQKLSLLTGTIDNNIEHVKSIHQTLMRDDAVAAVFRSTAKDPSDVNIRTLTTLLDGYLDKGIDYQSILPLSLDGTVYSLNPPAYVDLVGSNVFYEDFKADSNYLALSHPNTFPLRYTKPEMHQRNNITLYAQFFDYEDMLHIGDLAINFKRGRLFTNIEELASDTFTATYIIDQNNQVVYQIGDIAYELLPSSAADSDVIDIGDKDFTYFTSPLKNYNRWRIVVLFDNDLIRIETSQLNRYVYTTLLIALFLMVFVSLLISQKITDPIREMIHSMDEFADEKWPKPLITNNEDEIKDLVNGYNSMLTSFIKLTDNMLSNQMENQQIEIDLIKTQIGLLEAQINPHFIHNTLNSMNYLALSKGNRELSEVIESFNKLLRTSMAIDVSQVTITQEVENLKAYAKIQSVRFEDAFTIGYDVDPEAIIGKIPKLILQPFVENAITHGILPLPKVGHIQISIRKINDHLAIDISDDGIGMTQKMINQIVDGHNKKYYSEHIGIHNILDRIHLYYKNDFEFNINSTLNVGTTIHLVIPYED